MFSLRTARGRLAVIAVLLVGLVMVACKPSSQPDPIAEVLDGDSSTVEQDAGTTNDESTDDTSDGATSDGDSGDGDTGDGDTGDGDTGDDAGADGAVATAVDYRSCHEKQTAGGNSDGVFVISTDLPAGTAVEVDVIVQDGAQTVPLSGTVADDGTITVVAPLTNFGEGLELLAIRTGDGSEVDRTGVTTNFTVSETSDCSTHPDM